MSPLVYAADRSSTDKWTTYYWPMAAGLPHSRVNDLALGVDGLLWIATSNGLVQFDGKNFKSFNTHNVEAIPQNHFLSVHTTSDGKIVAGMDGQGILIFDGQIWRHIGTTRDLVDGHVRSITSDLDGNLWFGTDYGVYSIQGGQLRHFTVDNGLPGNIVNGIAMDVDGRIWAGTLQGGLAVYTSDGFIPVGSDIGGVLSLRRMGSSLWVGSFRGAFTIPAGCVNPVLINLPFYTAVTTFLGRDGSGVWAGTPSAGLLYLQASSGTKWIKPRFPEDEIIRCLLPIDKERIWVGGENGLYLLTQSIVDVITQGKGLPGNNITAITKGSTGELWIATQQGRFAVSDINGVRPIDIQDDVKSGIPVVAMVSNSTRETWAALQDGRLFYNQHSSFQLVPGCDILIRNGVTVLASSTAHELWIGSRRGLYYWHDGRVDLCGSAETVIHDLAWDAAGRLIVGTSDGIFRIAEQQWEEISSTCGLDISALHVDSEDIIWVAVRERGIISIVQDELRPLHPDIVEPLGEIYDLVSDEREQLWLATSLGLRCLPKYNTNLRLSGMVDAYDGLPGNISAGESTSILSRLADGRIAVATTHGVALVDPLDFKAFETPDNPKIKGLYREDRLAEGDVIHREGQSELMFHIISVSVYGGIRARYKYRVEGLDSLWIVGDNSYISIPVYNMESGYYRFAVQIVDARGIPSKTTYFNFSIKGKETLRIWVLLILIVITGAVYYFYKNRSKQTQKAAPAKYKTSALDSGRAEVGKECLELLMKQKHIYLDPDLSLKVLAQKCRLHPNHLSRIINEHYGMSYNDYINRKRIEKATSLLNERNQTLSIQEIMESAGFYSKSVFNTAFKKWTGETPSQYRRSHSA
ncbi:helix-turn-helix domain-containing protein [bacterium]|nr:helix-turn-helix domain-containing protein [bacterium]